MIGVIDYGAGNLRSVHNMLNAIGVVSRRIQEPADMNGLNGVILPGVGAFGSAMKKLEETGLADAVGAWLDMDLPFLGICLGLQLLFEGSDESPKAKGFGKFKGRCRRLQDGRVPHIGWNQVHTPDDLLYRGIGDDPYFYFLHSYAVDAKAAPGAGLTDYHGPFTASLTEGNCRAVQFHPEKSGEAGAKLLQNWVASCWR